MESTVKCKADKIKWTSSMEILLIDSFHEKRMLWDANNPLYFKKGMKKKGMEDIAAKLKEMWPKDTVGLTVDTLRQKFANLRTYFMREQKKKEANKEYLPKWEHYQRMLFMTETVMPSESQTKNGVTDGSYSTEMGSMENLSNEEESLDPLALAMKTLQEVREEPNDRAYWFVNYLKCELRTFSEENQTKLITELLNTLLSFRERLSKDSDMNK